MDIDVTISLKEGARVYVEDDTNYFLDLNSGRITSYSDVLATPGRALIVATGIPQPGLSQRSPFHLLKHADILLDDALATSNYTEAEKAKLKVLDKTIKFSRCHFFFTNIDAYREVIDYNSLKHLLYAFSLQDRNATLRDNFFNVTGTIFGSSDPLNLIAENLIMDTYSLMDAIYIISFCNYPGAYTEGWTIARNITVLTTSRRTVAKTPSIVLTNNLGNATLDGMNFTNYYMDPLDQTAAIYVSLINV